MKRLSKIVLVLSLLALAVPAAAKDKRPEYSPDGLKLVKDTEVAAVYAADGASLEAYQRVMLIDAYVAFKKNWQRDYNRTRSGLGMDIRDKDMEKIKEAVASEFSSVFTQVLEEGGYEITDETGPDVMIVRPAIINLDVTAPDLNTPGMRANIVSSAGFLTLYMELYDSVSNAKLAEIYDAQEAGNRNFAYRSNKVTNKQALDRTLSHWAGLLVQGLDHAKENEE